MPLDIFLSYSGQDTEWAQRLHSRLRKFRVGGQQLTVFFAPAAIEPGQSIPGALSEALSNARFLIAVITPAWLASEWCRLEGEVAVWRDPAANNRVLLPVLLKDCELPDALGRLKYADFRDERKFDQSLQDLVSVIKKGLVRAADNEHTVRSRREVLATPILPWLGFGGPSFDFVWPEMIIDPTVKLHKHPGTGVRLSEWLTSGPQPDSSCVAVVGDAGAGKTTALRTILLAGNGPFPEQRILVHARELPARIDALVSEIDDYTASAVLVDGLDEVGATIATVLGPSLHKLRSLRTTVVMASRTEFFTRQYELLRPHLGELTEVVEICGWEDDDIREFTRLYADRVHDESLVAKIGQVMTGHSGASRLIANPMRLTLLLYLLTVDPRFDPNSLTETYSLYRMFYGEWLKMERQRGTGGFNATAVRTAHTGIARWLYRNRGTLASYPVGPDPSDPITPDLLADSAFTELLMFEEDEHAARVITGFRHETLAEFLIAQQILESFRKHGPEIDAALATTVVDDVNGFVRSGFLEAPPPIIELYLKNLTAHYVELLAQGDGSPHNLRIREQLLYYIGRLPLGRVPVILQEAFEQETQPLLRRAAAISAIAQGEYEIEARYLALLDDPAEARLNRSVQMVYFGDVYDDLHTFLESGEDWSKTRAAIYRRLTAHQPREMRLRRWDLFTLRSFYASRGYVDVLSAQEREILRDVVLDDPFSPARSESLRAEHQLLVSALEV